MLTDSGHSSWERRGENDWERAICVFMPVKETFLGLGSSMEGEAIA
jgi:hypothetical protein